MSTILDALRKVERDRDSAPDHPLEPQTVAPEVRRRRKIPVAAIALCALLGFVGGGVLSWWSPGEEPAVEVTSLPAAPPPPAISVPRPPVREPAAPAVPAAVPPEPAAVAQAPVAAPVAPPAAQAAHAAAPAAPPAPESRPAAVADAAPVKPAGGPVGGQNVAAAPAADAPPAKEPETVAALGRERVALEPSPFAGPKGAAREGAPAAVPPAHAAPAAKPARPEADHAENEVAAVAPNEAVPPEPAPLDVEPEAESEPETPAETMVDTGRSPPGAPKVALSFLQWSADPTKRFAFVSIDGAPSQRIREGESAAGLTVSAITPNGVQFKREGTSFVIRPRH